MILINLIILSLQINQHFNIKDVEQLILSRSTKKYQFFTRIYTTDITAVVGKIVLTKAPKFAIISMESNRLHLFLHDNKILYNCIWDGIVRIDEKKEILLNTMNWWEKQNKTTFASRITDYEDGCIFADILKERETILNYIKIQNEIYIEQINLPVELDNDIDNDIDINF